MLNKKWFLLLGALLALKCSVAKANPVHIVSPMAGIDISTSKVAHILGPILFPAKCIFDSEVAATIGIPGPRVVIIDSPGGRVDISEDMLEIMNLERVTGVKYICVADLNAHSMAFNFLTFCDVRLATVSTHSIVHKIAMDGFDPDTRLTSKFLKDVIKSLDSDDEKYRRANAAAMHLTLRKYDQYADDQRMWSAPLLYFIGYLHGIATIDDDYSSPTQ